jgi:hypothetical protein
MTWANCGFAHADASSVADKSGRLTDACQPSSSTFVIWLAPAMWQAVHGTLKTFLPGIEPNCA